MRNDQLLTVIAVTYGHSRPTLEAFINCWMAQTDQRFKLWIMDDGPNTPHLDLYADYVDRFDNFSFLIVKENKGHFGHPLRQLGLEMTETKYLMWQNCDNLVASSLVAEATYAAEREKADILAWSVIHNYARGPWQLLDPYPSLNNIDFANFMVKTEVARQVGLRDLTFRGLDGWFVEDVIAAGFKWHKIDRALGIHQ